MKYNPHHYYYIHEHKGVTMAFDLGEGIPYDELVKEKKEYEEENNKNEV